jgi:hypothetical protein
VRFSKNYGWDGFCRDDELIWLERIQSQSKSQWWRFCRSKADYAPLHRFRLTEQEAEALNEALAKRDQQARQAAQQAEQAAEQPTNQTQEQTHHG